MRLVIYPNGRVRLSAPIQCSLAEIETFVNTKYEWLQTTLQRFRNQPQKQTMQYLSGEVIFLFGKAYTLQLQPNPFGNTVSLTDSQLLLRCKPDLTPINRKTIIEHFLRRQLQATLQPLVAQWQATLNEPNVTWSIRAMKSEWGSCTPRKRTMRFNLYLVHLPVSCIEYVVVHELSHLQVAGHGTPFKQLLTHRLPDWQQRKQTLNHLARTMV